MNNDVEFFLTSAHSLACDIYYVVRNCGDKKLKKDAVDLHREVLAFLGNIFIMGLKYPDDRLIELCEDYHRIYEDIFTKFLTLKGEN